MHGDSSATAAPIEHCRAGWHVGGQDVERQPVRGAQPGGWRRPPWEAGQRIQAQARQAGSEPFVVPATVS